MKVPQSPVSCDVLNDVQSFSKKILTWSHVQFYNSSHRRAMALRGNGSATLFFFIRRLYTGIQGYAICCFPNMGIAKERKQKANEEAWI
jgi:hypothetical protein